jgi:hypothetical protein
VLSAPRNTSLTICCVVPSSRGLPLNPKTFMFFFLSDSL